MKYKISLKCNSEQLFALFEEVLLNDFRLNTKKELVVSDLKIGTTYRKNISNNNTPKVATVTIKRYNRPKNYTVEYKRDDKYRLVSYDLEEVSPNRTEVVFRDNTYNRDEYQGNTTKILKEDTENFKSVPFMTRVRFMALQRQLNKRK